jgi:hypothetical protein
MTTNKPCCIDLYQGDDVIDAPNRPLAGFEQVKAQGIAFLDHKASQGTSETDTRVGLRYHYWMDGAPIAVADIDGTTLQLQPRFGFYHFNGGAAATAEAAHFISVVKPLFNKGDDLCLDWEDIGASGAQLSALWADTFCNAVEDWCGFPIKVYGGDAPRQQLAKADSVVLDHFAKRRVWFCQYGAFQPALVPEPWTPGGPFQWQDDGDKYGPGPHTIPGINNYCDNSTVVGSMTVAKLYNGWGDGSITVAAPVALTI